MNGIIATLSEICGFLNSLGLPYALIGGLAVSVRTEPRFTRDIALAIAVTDDAEAERILYELQNRGYLIQAIVEQQAAHRLTTARLQPPGQPSEGIIVDLLFASSGIEPEIVREATDLEVFQGLPLPVCRSGHLLALKILARDDVRRPQDTVDIRALLKDISQDEIELAYSAVRLITSRQFHRGRDLISSLDEFIRESRS